MSGFFRHRLGRCNNGRHYREGDEVDNRRYRLTTPRLYTKERSTRSPVSQPILQELRQAEDQDKKLAKKPLQIVRPCSAIVSARRNGKNTRHRPLPHLEAEPD